MNTKQEITQQYIQLYQEQPLSSFSYIQQEKDKAIDLFNTLGLPDKTNEKYQYNAIYKAFDASYSIATDQQKNIKQEHIFKCDILKLDAYVIILADGVVLEEDWSLPKGVHIQSISRSIQEESSLIPSYYNHLAGQEKDGLIALNTALSKEGLLIHIEKNVVLDKPIQIIHLQSQEDIQQMVSLRHLFVIEDNAQAQIIQCDEFLSTTKHLSNTVTEIFVKGNARLDLFKIQNEHEEATNISSTFVHQERDSYLSSHVIALMGKMIRNNLHIELDGENAETYAYGISLIDKKQRVDNYTFIHHKKPNCKSHELYKNIIDDEGLGIFFGKVLVAKDAQKTNAYQSNNNIILTADARMKTKPQLVIFADDVKCSHGATVGQLDDEALFYMQTRGITKKEAKMLLMYAFTNDIVNSISIRALRENTEDLIQRRLSGELSLCNNCVKRILDHSSL